MEIFKEVTHDFVIDALELLNNIESIALASTNNFDKNSLQKAIGMIHTIKGSSSFLKFNMIAKLSSDIEFLFEKIITNREPITPHILTNIAQSLQKLRQMLNNIKLVGKEGQADIHSISDEIHNLANNTHSNTTQIKQDLMQPQNYQSTFKSNDMSISERTPINQVKSQEPRSMAEASSLIKSAIDNRNQASKLTNTATKALIQHDQKAMLVDSALIDKSVKLLGELITSKSRLNRISKDIYERDHNWELAKELLAVNNEIGSISSDLTKAITNLHTQKVSDIFPRLFALVKDIQIRQTKEIKFIPTSGYVKLDKNKITEVSDILYQLVANACIHGVEKPYNRGVLGKSSAGKIILKTYQENENAVFEVADDGAGINLEEVKKIAVENGLAQGPLSKRDALDLLFKHGLSLSGGGKGRGLDFVKRAVGRLEGSIEINTQLNVGTIIRVKIPMKLTLINALIILNNDKKYALPIDCVQEIGILKGNISQKLGRNVVTWRDEDLPIIYLDEVFNIKRANSKQAKIMVVLLINHKKVALIVDEVLSNEQITRKSIGNIKYPLFGILGASVDVYGKPILILECEDILKFALNT